jgi:hypothetical protein
MFFRCPAFAFSAAVGVVFGFAPAPQLDPIDALRFE